MDITQEDVQAVLVQASKGDGRIVWLPVNNHATLTLGDWRIEMFLDAGYPNYVESASCSRGTRYFDSFWSERGCCPLDLLKPHEVKALERRCFESGGLKYPGENNG